jgi:hypothetical protein
VVRYGPRPEPAVRRQRRRREFDWCGHRFADQRRHERRHGAGQSASAIEPFLPETLVEGSDFDLAAAGRGVNELVVAEVDADVRERKPAGIEEHEVAGLQVVERDLVADPAHLLGRPRQRDAGHLLEHVADEPAAIEAGFGGVAAVLVVHPDQPEREDGEVLRGIPGGRCDDFDGCRRGFRQRSPGGILRRRHGGGHEKPCGKQGELKPPATGLEELHPGIVAELRRFGKSGVSG